MVLCFIAFKSSFSFAFPLQKLLKINYNHFTLKLAIFANQIWFNRREATKRRNMFDVSWNWIWFSPPSLPASFLFLACHSSYDPKLHVFTSTPFCAKLHGNNVDCMTEKCIFANNTVIECDLNQLQTRVSYWERRLHCPVIFITNLLTCKVVIKGQGEGTSKGSENNINYSENAKVNFRLQCLNIK